MHNLHPSRERVWEIGLGHSTLRATLLGVQSRPGLARERPQGKFAPATRVSPFCSQNGTSGPLLQSGTPFSPPPSPPASWAPSHARPPVDSFRTRTAQRLALYACPICGSSCPVPPASQPHSPQPLVPPSNPPPAPPVSQSQAGQGALTAAPRTAVRAPYPGAAGPRRPGGPRTVGRSPRPGAGTWPAAQPRQLRAARPAWAPPKRRK